MKDDVIFRSDAKKAIEEEIWISDSTKAAFRNILNRVPAADAEQICQQLGLVKEAFEMAKADLVPVVRCKDCQHTGITGRPPFMFRYCRHPKGLTAGMRETDFCPYGERRADE